MDIRFSFWIVLFLIENDEILFFFYFLSVVAISIENSIWVHGTQTIIREFSFQLCWWWLRRQPEILLSFSTQFHPPTAFLYTGMKFELIAYAFFVLAFIFICCQHHIIIFDILMSILHPIQLIIQVEWYYIGTNTFLLFKRITGESFIFIYKIPISQIFYHF